MQQHIQPRSISNQLLYGFAIASVGGPLALLTIYFFSTAYTGSSVFYTVVLGVALFIAPLFIWYRYSDKIVSSGGLYSFVKSSIGERWATVQGWIWLVSYFLYLPYTITYITYSILPNLINNISWALPLIQIILTAAAIIPLMISFRKSLYFIFGTAILQLVVVAIFGYFLFGSGVFVHSHAAQQTDLLALGGGAFAVSLLFICTNLPVYLGPEAKGGSRAIRKALLLSFGIVAAALIIMSMALLHTPQKIAGTEIPGFFIATQYISRNFGYLVAAVTLISLVDLVIIEFVAITRLSYVMLNLSLDKTVIGVSTLFIVADLIAILNPEAIYNSILVISLIALYASQVIVFAAYPFFAKKQLKFNALDILASAIASLLVIYGLYTVIAPYLTL